MISMLNMPKILADTNDWGSFWMPPARSTIAPEVDWLFNFIMAICVFFFFLILILLVVFAIKYRYREGAPPLDAPKHNTALELTWTFVPTVIVVIIFVYGFKGFVKMAVAPPYPYEVDVTASMWQYSFRYPNNHVDNVLHIPTGKPVQLVLNSLDVIHGFYIPDFRIKKDDVPGRYNKIWIIANDLPAGQTSASYDIFCTQYCGQGHSTMRSHVVVHTPDDFASWMKTADIVPGGPDKQGAHVVAMNGCAQCHTIDGTAGKGPTWKDVYGSMVTLKDGTKMLADENFLYGVISKANSHEIPGFDPIMPQFNLQDKDVRNIIAYIKTLSVHYQPEGLTTQPAANIGPATAPAPK